jgi:hypothetical protein
MEAGSVSLAEDEFLSQQPSASNGGARDRSNNNSIYINDAADNHTVTKSPIAKSDTSRNVDSICPKLQN